MRNYWVHGPITIGGRVVEVRKITKNLAAGRIELGWEARMAFGQTELRTTGAHATAASAAQSVADDVAIMRTFLGLPD